MRYNNVMSSNDIRRAWDRQEDESTMWYDRFLLYRSLGPDRTLQEAYRRYRVRKRADTKPEDISSISSSWSEEYHKRDWAGRAAAWDDYIRDSAQAELERLAVAWRIQSVEDMIQCWKDLQDEWQAIKAGGMRRNQVAQAMKTLSREITIALGGVTDRKSVQVDIILNKLPPELREVIRLALERNEE